MLSVLGHFTVKQTGGAKKEKHFLGDYLHVRYFSEVT
jgi:hypothetical protein